MENIYIWGKSILMFTPDYILYMLVLAFVSIYSLFIYSKLSKPYKPIAILIWFTFIEEIFTRFFAHWINNSSIVYHIYAPFQLILIGLVYYLITQKKGLLVGLAGVISLNIANSIFLQNIHTEFPTNSLIINSAFILLASLYVLYFFTQQLSQGSTNVQGPFWFIAANLIFFSSIIPYFSFMNYLSLDLKMFEIATLLLTLMSILINILYFLSLYNTVKKQSLNHK